MNVGKLGLTSVALVLGLSACEMITGGPGPSISSFTASPELIAPGESSTLSWTVDSSATSVSITPGIGSVTGQTSVTVTPSTTTEYTLTATNAEGSNDATTTVTVDGNGSGGNGPGPGPGPDPVPGAPTGTFGVSTSPTGPFLNDRPEGIQSDDDERVISVSGGETFYAQVQYADADGITDVRIDLVNSSPEGIRGSLSTEPRAGFTLGEPTGDCDLGSSSTQVTCVYPITVAPGTPAIEDLPDSGDEFAYVFRTYVTDALGNESAEPIRGYVNID